MNKERMVSLFSESSLRFDKLTFNNDHVPRANFKLAALARPATVPRRPRHATSKVIIHSQLRSASPKSFISSSALRIQSPESQAASHPNALLSDSLAQRLYSRPRPYHLNERPTKDKSQVINVLHRHTTPVRFCW